MIIRNKNNGFMVGWGWKNRLGRLGNLVGHRNILDLERGLGYMDVCMCQKISNYVLSHVPFPVLSEMGKVI